MRYGSSATSYEILTTNTGAAKTHTHTKAQITDFPTSLPANGGTSSYTNYINYTSRAGKGDGTAQFAQYHGETNNPTNDWYSHIIMNHANSGGYYTEIAACFHTDSVYFRRQSNGTTYGWKKFAWTSDIPTNNNQLTNGAGYITSSGSITGSSGSCTGNAATATRLDSITASTSTLYVTGCTSSTSNLYSGTQSTSGVRIVSGSKLYAANGFFQSSDERLKEFFNPISVDLEKLKKLRKSYFKFKGEDTIHIGVSAQEIKELYPEIVSETDNIYNVDYSKLAVVALKGIDALYDMILELKEENRELRRLANL